MNHFKSVSGGPQYCSNESQIFQRQLTLPDLQFTLTLWGSQMCNFRIDLYLLYGCGSFMNHSRSVSGGPQYCSNESQIFQRQLTLPDLQFTLTLWGSQMCNFRIDLYSLYGYGSFINHSRSVSGGPCYCWN